MLQEIDLSEIVANFEVVQQEYIPSNSGSCWPNGYLRVVPNNDGRAGLRYRHWPELAVSFVRDHLVVEDGDLSVVPRDEIEVEERWVRRGREFRCGTFLVRNLIMYTIEALVVGKPYGVAHQWARRTSSKRVEDPVEAYLAGVLRMIRAEYAHESLDVRQRQELEDEYDAALVRDYHRFWWIGGRIADDIRFGRFWGPEMGEIEGAAAGS